MARNLASWTSVVGLVIVGALMPARADGASISFESEIIAQGGGGIPEILRLQGAGNATTESGAITPSGETGDAKSQSDMWTVTELAALGINSTDTEFGIVLNIDESGSGDNESIDLQSLVMTFYNSAGATLFTASLGGIPFHLTEAGQGVGSSGYLFRVSLSPAEATSFFGTAGNQIGLASTIFNIDNGPEIFSLADIEEDTPITPIPEPATLGLLAAGLGAAGIRRLRGRRSI